MLFVASWLVFGGVVHVVPDDALKQRKAVRQVGNLSYRFAEEERITAKDRQIAEAIFIAALFLIVAPTAVEACVDGNQPSITQWWDEGARFRQGCRCGYEDPFNRFWGNDLIGNLFHNYCHGVAGYTIPLWNGLTASWFGTAILAVIAGVFGAAICDLLKDLLKSIFSEQPKQ